MHDVVIAGAGPAGAIAATVLARAGARVLVLDRARFPRDKLCGDTLNPGALAILARLGLAAAAAGGLALDGMIVTGPTGVRVVGRYGIHQGTSISRRRLDMALIVAASDAGAEIEEDVLVQEASIDSASHQSAVDGLLVKRRDGRTRRIPARMVIAADGRYSRVGRAIGLSQSAAHPRRWAVGAYFHDVGQMGTFGEMHVRRGRYIGVAPLPDGLANACAVAPGIPGGTPAAFLRQSLSSDPMLRERFATARMVGSVVTLGPLGVDCTGAGVPGLLLAGDAAGFVDPMTGDGLRFAFRGGELAALEALDALASGQVADAHIHLARTRAREFATKWRFNRTLRLLVAYPGAVRAAGYAATLAPQVLRRAIQYAGDVHAA
jgi:flavin-dependent dehydrogenase